MKDFVSYIKNISTEEFIKFWGEISILIYQKQLNSMAEEKLTDTMDFPLLVNHYGKMENVPVMVTAWDIPEMIYMSICSANDYRSEDMSIDKAGIIVNLYRGYENNKFKSSDLKEASLSGLYSYLMGMTYEQFIIQRLAWTLQNSNRNYHLLVASDKINRNGIIDIDHIVREKFDMSVDEFIANQLIILWLCGQHSDPLNAPETLYRDKISDIVTKDRMKKIIEYYSVDYQQVRDSKIQKQIFYSKPFVRTQRNQQTLLVSMHLLQMVFADSLYWLERDYYHDNNLGQAFLNAFGGMFEDYFKELAGQYLEDDMWNKIPEGKGKSADFYIEFDRVLFVFELKSGIMGIGAKQQMPDLEQIDKFYERNIREAYEQLIASETAFQAKGKPIIKVFLLYEFTNNTQIMSLSLPEIFENNTNTYILTIADLEMFLATYKQDNNRFQGVIDEILNKETDEKTWDFLYILNKHKAIGNRHFIGKKDYLRKILTKLKVPNK